MNTILITGATGFVGGRLLASLRDSDDHDVRVIVRDADKLESTDGIDVVEGDLDDRDTLDRALDGVSIAYYLVHSMEGGQDDFAERDRQLAEGFVDAAGRAGVERLVYLGGVVPDGATSEHLDSRLEVERVLGGGEPELVALRASMVVGAASDSFRTLAQIVERLPVLALPSWRDTKTQPISVDDVVAALSAAGGVEPGAYDVAGPDTLSIEEMIEAIGELTGNERSSFHLPISSSKLEGAAAALVTDSDREVLEPLMAGLHEDLAIEHNRLEEVFGVTPTPFREAAGRALDEMREAETL